MAGTTSRLKLPYPTGTDRVMDGDNAIQALAERMESVNGALVLSMTAVTAGKSVRIRTGYQSVTSDAAGNFLLPLSPPLGEIVSIFTRVGDAGTQPSRLAVPYGSQFTVGATQVTFRLDQTSGAAVAPNETTSLHFLIVDAVAL